MEFDEFNMSTAVACSMLSVHRVHRDHHECMEWKIKLIYLIAYKATWSQPWPIGQCHQRQFKILKPKTENRKPETQNQKLEN